MKKYRISGTVLTKYYGEDAYIALPEGLTEIGKYAFAGNVSLKQIILPSTLKKIDFGAFSESSLRKVKINRGLREIGDGAFANCIDLGGDFIFPESLVYLGECAFNDTDLHDIFLPGQMKTVRFQAFSGCHSLNIVCLKTGIMTIEGEAFSNSVIRSLIVPDGLRNYSSRRFVQSAFHGAVVEELVCSCSWMEKNDDLIKEINPENITCLNGD